MSLSPRNAILSVSWSLLSLAQGIARSILWPYLFLTYWPSKQYAFWVIIFSVYAMVIYISEGYIRYSVNEYNLHYFQNKQKAYTFIRGGLKFLRRAYIFIGIVVSLSLLLPAPDMFGLEAMTTDIRYCLILIMFTGFVHSYSKYTLYAMEPTGRIHIAGQYVTIYGIIELLLGIAAALTAISLPFIFLFYFATLLVFSIVFVSRVVKRHEIYKEISEVDDKGNNGIRVFTRSLFFVTNNFLEKMVLDGLNFMISFFYKSVTMLLSFTTTRTMSNLPLTTTNTITSTFGIEYQRLNTVRNGNGIMDLLSMVWTLTGGLVNLGMVILYPLFTVLYVSWTHGKLPVDNMFFYLVFSVAVLNVYGTNVIFYLKSLNITKPLVVVSVARLLMICVTMGMLPKNLKSIGVSLFISEAFINLILLNFILYMQLIKMNCTEIWKKMVINIAPFLVTVIFLLGKDLLPWPDVYKILSIATVLAVLYFFQLGSSKDNLYITKSIEYLRSGLGRKK